MRKDKSTRSFKATFISDNYATETLINGNITECIKYLKDLLECGNSGMNQVYEELNSIKEHAPGRYNFIKTTVFAMPSYDNLKSLRH